MFKQRSGLLEFPTRNVDVSRLAKQIVIIQSLNESSAQGRLTAGTVIEIFAPEDLPERAVELLLREMFARAGQSPEDRKLAAAGPCHTAPSSSGHAPVLKRS